MDAGCLGAAKANKGNNMEQQRQDVLESLTDEAHIQVTYEDEGPKFKVLFHELAKLAVPDKKEEQVSLGLMKKYVQLALNHVQNSQFRITHTFKAGSMGRATNIPGRSDLDIVAFVKVDLTDELRSSALSWAWTVFAGNGAVKPTRPGRQHKPSPYVLAFEDEKTGLEIDFLVAQDTVTTVVAGDNRTRQQQDNLVRPLLDNPRAARPDKARCIALGESLTECVKALHANVNDAVRLTKLWVKAGLVNGGLLGADIPDLNVKIKVPGILIEVVVMFACQELMTGQSKSNHHKCAEQKEIQPWHLFRETLRILQRLGEATPDKPEQVILDLAILEQSYPTGTSYASFTPAQALQFSHCWGCEDRVVLHPIDPTWNIAYHVGIRMDPRGPDYNTKGMHPETWTRLGEQAKALRKALRTQSWHHIMTQTTLGTAAWSLAQTGPEL